MSEVLPAGGRARWPRQIRYIIGNEACERFSFYGMRNILTVFLVEYLLRAESAAARPAAAKSVFHLFVMGVYFFPLLGGYLADRFWGKYRTILWLSLVYCAGHACLAVFDEDRRGFYLGLVLIALGSGGIKPCVSSFVGDQFTEQNKHLARKVFAAFYWSINLGSFFASLLIPKTLKLYGPSVAFGIPGALMLIATIIFWAGRRHYVDVPPTGRNPHSFLRVVISALRAPRRPRSAAARFLDRAADRHPPEAIAGVRAVLRLVGVLVPIPFFWMLFDQKASTWVLQARAMDLQVGPFTFEPAQLQFINPALVMILIPLTTNLLYPAFDRLGWPLSPLRRMTAGMFCAGASFVMVAVLQGWLDAGARPSVLWQLGPYVALTLGEVLISVTGLEFAYSQAPAAMKGTIMSLWLLATAAGNLVVAILAKLDLFAGEPAKLLLFYAALVSVAGVALGLVARRYVVVDHFRRA